MQLNLWVYVMDFNSLIFPKQKHLTEKNHPLKAAFKKTDTNIS